MPMKFGMQDFPPKHVRPKPNRASRDEKRQPLPKPTTATPTPPTVYTGNSTRAIGHTILIREGFSEGEWTCLDALWTRESNWETQVANPSSGAYGIPQALPGEKMASFGADWRTNPVTQIEWGLWYIKTQYGTPCGALAHSNETGYY